MTLDWSSNFTSISVITNSGLSSSLNTGSESSASLTTNASDLIGRTSIGSSDFSITSTVFGFSTCLPASDCSCSFTSSSAITNSGLSTSFNTPESSVSFATIGSDSLIIRTSGGSRGFSTTSSNDTGTSTVFSSSWGNSSKDDDEGCSSASLGTNSIAGATDLPLTTLVTGARTLDICGSGMGSFTTSFSSSTGISTIGASSIILTSTVGGSASLSSTSPSDLANGVD
ncbi:hypothetical protein OIU74_021237 [Salix koriyanagi]|uniref:Uncharacterized protein n=1 Tax=Salix koriyanagi TaxID=2511006 RepID=A0A9Q0P7R2_9ROSI|nr:hypothetical protein OIU74_021237 [Salix koriyanagi]